MSILYCPYCTAAADMGGGLSGRSRKHCSFLLRGPAFLFTVSETTGLNMISARLQACQKKTVVAQKCVCSGLWPQGMPEPPAAWGEWQKFYEREVRADG